MSKQSFNEQTTKEDVLKALVGNAYDLGFDISDEDKGADKVGEVEFNNLGMDSLDFVEFSIEAERTFEITLPDADIEDARTFGKFADVVLVKLSKVTPA